MRDLPQPVLDALASPVRYHYLRVLVEDPDGYMADVSDRLGLDWLHGISRVGDIDQLARTLALRLRRAFGAPSQNRSLAPQMEGSEVNRDADGYYAPWIDFARQTEVYTAISLTRIVPEESDWHLIFSGRLDKWDSANPVMELPARDGYGVLLDQQTRTVRTYGSESGLDAEDVAQDFLDDSLGSLAPALYVPVSPEALITDWRPGDASVGELLAGFAESFGSYIRQRWDDGTDDYRLTLFDVDPDDLEPVFTFPPGTYYRVTKFEVDSADIRNAILGTFPDPVTGNPVSVYREDAESIARLANPAIGDDGRRYATITEGPGSPVRTVEQLTVLVETALAALKDPPASVAVEAMWNPFLEEGDVVEFAADGVNSDTDIVVAVKALSDDFVPGRQRTLITGRARPAGAYLRWRKRARDRRGGTGGDLPDLSQATIEAFSIQEVNTADGQYTMTTIVLGAHTARYHLYERDGAWPTTDGTETGPVDPIYQIGAFDSADSIRPLRTVPPDVTRYAIALSLNGGGKFGDRRSASTGVGGGGEGTEGPASIYFGAEANVDRVRIFWTINATIAAAPGRFKMDVFRDSLIIALNVAAEDEEAEDTDAVPCAGGFGNDCQYFEFIWRGRLRDTLSIYPTVEYTAPIGRLWESFTL